MLRLIIGIFLIIHGLVHLLYFGQSRRLFDLATGMNWPDASWAFSSRLGNQKTRLLASVCCVLVAIGFATGGIGLLSKQDWWQVVAVGSSLFSILLFVLFWDKKLSKLHDKGGIGIIINVSILVAIVLFDWPNFDF